ncbi:hypothetical protein [Alteromonas sp. KUL106]|uniref:hypothetical protein n=1 Tax=Alteromonas sp. KUL106 TaxID=2480799 RepID=UPI0012E538F5|nr:hypothetical protein [Alteromonas sp. KUL106]GFD67690.1 hypothetical protein KUL106_09530 [Alteromonas sp. KUL106]
MSNKSNPNTKPLATTDNASIASADTATSPLKSSPLFGWLYAGTDLISAKLDQAAGVVSQKIDDTHETINAMQAKGLEVESELRKTLNPFAMVNAAQKFVSATPLFSVFSGGQKRQQKEQQLEALNAKVDLLVEQVALLAAKEAAKQVKARQTVETTPATTDKSSSAGSATKPPRARKTTASTTKASAAGATAPSKRAASSNTSKSAAAKTATRKSTAATKATAAKATRSGNSESPEETKKND